MFDTTPEDIHRREQLLGLAAAMQHDISLDDPADYWYRKGSRDAYAYAAAVVALGQPGGAARAAADRVGDILDEGTLAVGELMAALHPSLHREVGDGLTWVGPIAFNRLTATQAGIDHDHGTRWGTQRDIRISHRRPLDGQTGLLYAYDRTWDEYAILADDIHTDVVEAAAGAALATDPHPLLEPFLQLLREARVRHTPVQASLDSRPVLR